MQARRFLSATIVAALVSGIVGLSAPSASALTSSESSFVSKINHERTSRGKHSLSVASDLVAVARKHSAQMAAKGEIYHNSHLGSDVSNWFVLGENVGVGPDVTSLHRAFMNSPHHRENILYTDYNRIGVGVVKGSDGYLYVTEVFAGRHTTVRRTTSTTTVRRTSSSTTTPRRTVAHTTTTSRARTSIARTASAPAARPTQTVDLLVRMAGLDANTVDPATGAATGA